ncbi:hypothetical protein A0H81_07374 [Grifola frondosa]|uniref:SAM domain-containing protein n=1 Tax=Grifola frondosa TaxID=5627 RepID=A0A1C7M540_GRIFR|nr:hypothetical protein A0H81_07374 [Grifola frondosa]
MATTRTLPTPPSRAPSLGYTPSSPTKRDPALKPNPHPYAIRTTSTALLSRSNSSGHNVNATHHYYIPLSPSHNRTSEHKGHRLSKSLNSTSESPRSAPRPLPVPPSFQSHTRAGNGPVPDNGRGGYVSADETCAPSRHSRRAETLPLIPLFDTTPHPTATLEDLPSNPKLWTPSQLSSYLVTALRVTLHTHSGEDDQVALPFPIAKDIAAFVKDARIGGRMFLRLNEEDLEGMGMTKRWREALLAASRNLRQNVLKGRIWGPDAANSHSPDSGSPPRPSRIFANAQYNSSSSSIESFASDGEDADKFHHVKASRNGRVRGMVATFERSGSFSSESGFDGDQERTTAGRWLREKRSMEEDAIRSPSPTDRRPFLLLRSALEL